MIKKRRIPSTARYAQASDTPYTQREFIDLMRSSHQSWVYVVWYHSRICPGTKGWGDKALPELIVAGNRDTKDIYFDTRQGVGYMWFDSTSDEPAIYRCSPVVVGGHTDRATYTFYPAKRLNDEDAKKVDDTVMANKLKKQMPQKSKNQQVARALTHPHATRMSGRELVLFRAALDLAVVTHPKISREAAADALANSLTFHITEDDRAKCCKL